MRRAEKPKPEPIYDPWTGKVFESPSPVGYWEEFDTQRAMTVTTVRAWSDMFPANPYFQKLRERYRAPLEPSFCSIRNDLRSNAVREDSAILAMKGLRQEYYWYILDVEKAYLESGVRTGDNRLVTLRQKVTHDVTRIIGMEYLPEGRAMIADLVEGTIDWWRIKNGLEPDQRLRRHMLPTLMPEAEITTPHEARRQRLRLGLGLPGPDGDGERGFNSE